ncbi:unnamed protein product [Durusdinium trenchii]|uniref:Uncharacterized protein n=1 Tax=Durusdinium trenchii TaxID=1381693 RepID=A0ABP0SWN9_9DINO
MVCQAGAALKMTDRILWGEICNHQHGGKPTDEARKRQDGYLAVNVASVIEFDADHFAEGDHVAVIDCMTFVPEYIPVLKALEKQRDSNLPFEGGAYLNLCSWHRPDVSNVLGEDDVHMSRLQRMVDSLIAESTLQPFIEIRRDEHLADRCSAEITTLLQKATLDPGQLRSFIDGLRNPVHLTQGARWLELHPSWFCHTRTMQSMSSLWTW